MTGAIVRNSRPDSPARAGRLKSCLCTQAQLESGPFRAWVRRMGLTFKHHRKLWEFAFIAEALEQHGMLTPGRRGLGFAVGREHHGGRPARQPHQARRVHRQGEPLLR